MHIFKSVLAAAAVASAVTFLPQTSAQAGGHGHHHLPDALAGGTVIKTANFSGTNNHTVSGEVQIVQKGEVFYAVLGKDFSFDGAPDPRLGFSSDDNFIASTTFSGLNQDSGQQIYRLPASLDVASTDLDELTIWCEKFSVELAEAKF